MVIRRRRHYGFATFAYFGLTGLLALGAINSQNNLLFFVFGLSLAAVLVSGVVSGTALMRIRARREPVGVGQVGEPMRIRYELTNTGRVMPIFALTVREREHPRAPRGRERRERAPTWPGHMPEPGAFVAHVAARGSVHAEAVVRPTRRGLASFHALRVETSFPFGMMRKSALFVPGSGEAPAVALIRPRAARVSPTLFREASREAAEGEATAHAVGRADEFFGLRDYAPGDTLRQIAWRPSARTGNLVVRENISHAPTRVWVMLVPVEPGEAASVEEERDLTEAAVSLAAGVIEEAGRQAIEIGLYSPPGAGAVEIAPRPGPAHVGRLLDALAVIALPACAGDALAREPLPSGAQRAIWIVVHAGDRAAPIGPPGAVRLRARGAADEARAGA